jgi:hypothetical protein
MKKMDDAQTQIFESCYECFGCVYNNKTQNLLLGKTRHVLVEQLRIQGEKREAIRTHC